MDEVMTQDVEQGVESSNYDQSNYDQSGIDQSGYDESTNFDQPIEANGNVFEWDKYGLNPNQDKRFGSMWKSPEDLYKSYKSIEPQFQQSKQKLSEYEQRIQGYESGLGKFKQAGEYLNSILNHPVHGQQFNQLLENYERSLKQEKYGENIPDAIVEKLQRMEQIEAHLQNQEEEKRFNAVSGQIESALSEIDKFAQQKNLDFDKREFLEYCRDNDIPPNPRLMTAVFKDLAMEKIVELTSSKTQESVLKNINKNRLNSSVSNDRNTNQSRSNSNDSTYDRIVSHLTS